MFQREVLLEEVEAGFPVYLLEQARQFIPAAENTVKLTVSKSYNTVILDAATVVNLINIGPHTGAQAHMARFSCCIDCTS